MGFFQNLFAGDFATAGHDVGRFLGLERQPTPQATAASQFTIDPNAARFDAAQSDQTRAQQGDFVQALMAASRGQGPSAAQAQLQGATDANIRNALALAQSMRGGGYQSALRGALNAGAMAQQQSANQAATLRAQEQQAAQGMLGSALGQMRTQDLSAAQAQQSANMGMQQLQAQNSQFFANLEAQQREQDLARLYKLISGGGQGMAASGTNGMSGGAAASQGVMPGRNGSGSTNSTVVGAPVVSFSGGRIPGRAPMDGDNPGNDIVPAMLSPGEVVIPRSIINGPDAPRRAAEFVAALQAKGYSQGGVACFSDGGVATEPMASQPPAGDPGLDIGPVNVPPWAVDAWKTTAKSGLSMLPFAAPLVTAAEAGRELMPKDPVEQPKPAGAPGGINFTPRASAAPAAAQPKQPTGPATPYVPGPNKQALDEYKAGSAEAVGAQQKALDTQAQIAAEQGTREADIRKDAMNQEAEINAHQAQMQAEYKVTRQAQMDKYQQAVEKFSSMEANPGRLWASASTGDKLLAGIGLALGSFSPDGVNHAVSVINQAIDRDLEAQRVNIDKAGKSATMQESLLGIMREQFGDDAAALAAARSSMRELALQRIEEMKARTSGPEKAAQLDALKAQLQQGHLKDLNTAQTQFDAHATTAAAQRGQLALQAQQNAIAAAAAKAKAQKGAGLAGGALEIVDELARRFKEIKVPGVSAIPGTAADDYEEAITANAMTIAAALRPGGKPPKNAQDALKVIREVVPSSFSTRGNAADKFETLRQAIMAAQNAPASPGGYEAEAE